MVVTSILQTPPHPNPAPQARSATSNVHLLASYSRYPPAFGPCSPCCAFAAAVSPLPSISATIRESACESTRSSVSVPDPGASPVTRPAPDSSWPGIHSVLSHVLSLKDSRINLWLCLCPGYCSFASNPSSSRFILAWNTSDKNHQLSPKRAWLGWIYGGTRCGLGTGGGRDRVGGGSTHSSARPYGAAACLKRADVTRLNNNKGVVEAAPVSGSMNSAIF